jgi:type II secretory pathway pseudopilin PulG
VSGIGTPELLVILVPIIIIVVIIGAIFFGSFALAGYLTKGNKDAQIDPAQEKSNNAKKILLGCGIGGAATIFFMMILSIFAAIAIPNFILAREKSRQSEARTILAGIYEAENAFYLSNNRFSADPNELGFATASEPKYYQWQITFADDTHFVAAAWGNIDRDATIDTWVVTEKGRDPENTIDDTSQ